MTNIEKSQYEITDALDDQQIVDEMKGQIIDQYFYEFKQGGKQVVGISWAGIKFVSRKMSMAGQPISVEEIDISEREDSFTAKACAMDVNTREKRWGVATCPKKMTLRDGSQIDDTFAEQKALSKAQRNAIRHFIPETVLQEGYKAWKSRSGGGTGQAMAGPPSNPWSHPATYTEKVGDLQEPQQQQIPQSERCDKCTVRVSEHPSTRGKVMLVDKYCAFNPDLDCRTRVETMLQATGYTADVIQEFKEYWQSSGGKVHISAVSQKVVSAINALNASRGGGSQ